MNRRRHARRMLPLLVLALATSTGATLAAAAPGALPEAEQSASPAYIAAHDIAAAGLSAPDDGTVGYGGTQYDVGADSVDLWWKGSLDPAVAERVETARHRGVRVEVHAAPATRAGLSKSVKGLFGPAMKRAGVTVVTAWARDDMSGFDIDIDAPAVLGRDRAAWLSTVRRLGEAQTGVPILTVTERRPADQLRRAVAHLPDLAVAKSAFCTRPCRQNDVEPWTAGSGILSESRNEFCTTGFSVTLPTILDTTRFLTAAHCDTNPLAAEDSWRTGQATPLVAAPVLPSLLGYHPVAPKSDVMMLNPDGDTQPYMYLGAWNGRTKVPVRGVETSLVNDEVSTSGGNSGQHDKLVVRQVLGFTDADCYGSRYEGDRCPNLVRASLKGEPTHHRNKDYMAVAQGDSGGPVYRPADDKNTAVYARGVIHGGIYRVDKCATLFAKSLAVAPAGLLCHTELVYTDLTTARTEFGNSWTVMTLPR